MARIIVCGGNGTGKSTLGKALAHELGWKFADIEDYYFVGGNTEYDYEAARTRDEVTDLLLKDLREHKEFVLAAVKGDYRAASKMFECAVFASVPKEIRKQRVWERSYKKFGNRILPGGDLYEHEKSFFDMVESRSDDDVTAWLDTLHVPVIKIDGTQPVEESVAEIKRQLAEII